MDMKEYERDIIQMTIFGMFGGIIVGTLLTLEFVPGLCT